MPLTKEEPLQVVTYILIGWIDCGQEIENPFVSVNFCFSGGKKAERFRMLMTGI